MCRCVADVWRLCWPFLVWNAIVIVAYAIAYAQQTAVLESLENFKLAGRVQVQASRVMYLMGKVALLEVGAFRVSRAS